MKRWLLLCILGTICIASIWTILKTYQANLAEETTRKVLAGNKQLFEQAFQRLTIGQRDEQLSWPVAEFEKGRMPKEPIQLGLHKNEAFIHIDVATGKSLEAAENFLSQVEVYGDVKFSTSVREVSSGNYQLSMYFSEITDQFAFRFGNIPTVVLKRMDPLKVTIEPFRSEGAVMLLPEGKDSSSLFLTEGIGQLALHFSEPMVGKLEKGRPVNGYPAVWLDEQTISLDIRQMKGYALDLTQFHSQTGNYLPEEYRYVALHKKEKRTWLTYPASKVVGMSPYDSFYQQMFLSPDQKSYVGMIRRGSNLYKKGGITAALVLERAGMPPVFIEHDYTTPGTSPHVTLQWLDQERFLYIGEKTGTVYHVSSGEKKLMFDERNTGMIALESAVDKEAGSVYVVDLLPTGVKNRYVIERRTYRLDSLAWEKTESFGEVSLQPRENYPALPIRVRSNGVYTTTSVNGKLTVQFTSRQGQSWTTAGELIWADDNGRAVVKRTGKEKSTKYYWWQIGKPLREIPLARGEMRSFGPYLIVDDGLRYQLWDGLKKSWELLDLAEGMIKIPVSDDAALYSRVR
ncbi:hypothetical protein NDK47_16635 [Brevibacillus ruminantium]|uniref:Arylsulfotransferase N-terminal domain-containing protein n=1 Tax=Brevibacillus ruminantium TaxID=2950604 RepID=A0ABY4WAJ5_9BACL|nr:hypothetical protein [Brevibacillus ruminantium]USG63794.1 hypothetical protein NDK47_16635 [Brevibacillus ruminantium]